MSDDSKAPNEGVDLISAAARLLQEAKALQERAERIGRQIKKRQSTIEMTGVIGLSSAQKIQ